MPDVLDVVVFLELLQQQPHHLDLVGVGQGDIVVRDHLDLGGIKGIPLALERFQHAAESGRFAGDLDGAVLHREVVGAGVHDVLHHLVLGIGLFLVVDDEDALLLEAEGNAAGGAHVAAELVEQVADVARGAVFVVGQRLDDDRDPAGAVALVGVVLVAVLAAFAGRLFDDPLDVVVGDVVGFRLGDQHLQGRVVIGVAAAHLDGNGNFTPDFGEDLRLGAIGFLFLSFDVVPFGMSRHENLPFNYFFQLYILPAGGHTIWRKRLTVYGNRKRTQKGWFRYEE